MNQRLLDQHAELLRTAIRSKDAIDSVMVEISEIEKKLEDIDGNTCTGTEYWRDQDHATRAPKLYIIHSTNESCPMHGTPEDGGRIRTYIGADETAIAEAQEAMALEQKRRKLAARLRKLKNGIVAANSSMGRALRYIGWKMEGGELKKARIWSW